MYESLCAHACVHAPVCDLIQGGEAVGQGQLIAVSVLFSFFKDTCYLGVPVATLKKNQDLFMPKQFLEIIWGLHEPFWVISAMSQFFKTFW